MVIVWKKERLFFKMTKIADTIAAFFVKSKLITKEEREVSRYGIEILISTIVGLGIIILMMEVILNEKINTIRFKENC